MLFFFNFVILEATRNDNIRGIFVCAPWVPLMVKVPDTPMQRGMYREHARVVLVRWNLKKLYANSWSDDRKSHIRLSEIRIICQNEMKSKSCCEVRENVADNDRKSVHHKRGYSHRGIISLDNNEL